MKISRRTILAGGAAVAAQSADLGATRGSPANSYFAKAVHFDGSAYLAQFNTAIGNSYTGALSVWAKVSTLVIANTIVESNQTGVLTNSWSSIQFGFNAPGDVGTGFEISPGGYAGSASDNGLITVDTWGHVFASWNTNSASNKTFNIFYNGRSVANPANYIDSKFSGPVQWNFYTARKPQGGDFYVPGPAGTYAATDYADFQMWVGTYIEPTADNLARFISEGKPVNPRIAATAFGKQTILFSGDSASYGNNQGTVGAFVLTGTITNASTSPSE